MSKEQAQTYVDQVLASVKERNPHEEEFQQATEEILESLVPLLAEHPKYQKFGILERMVEPDRLITFRVPWVDDEGTVQVNRGYRVQFNAALGPYKGGLRFDPSVNSSIIKFLGFEQIFKNSLTGQGIGGGKGGADFNPKGKSNAEIMRFTQSFMSELAKYIGPNVDVPAGDIGVGGREINYMVGQYKKINGTKEAGAFTGKEIDIGGSLTRTESTGYGVVYFVENMLKEENKTLEGQRVVVSGAGKVSIYAMEKAVELGGTVVACNDSSGYIYDKNGINVETIKQIKEVEKKRIHAYTEHHPEAEYYEDKKIWEVACDVALPCATQNELDEEDAKRLVENGVRVVAEGANMPCTLEAFHHFRDNNVQFAPSKAANAGGVAVSALEMAQNSSRVSWSFEEVDTQLKEIMKEIFDKSLASGRKYRCEDNLSDGANIAGFKKVADAMIAQGIV
ncbi:NADP-specific glutamate dehydrogenase [Geomicrobium sp. JCM 19039]|uniref:NADP-specific glutamate dehydrogenase n=1 Tax=Geomicrobium sp. JCM 19039 TaxID=1460636 RepID=UPI00045F4DC8|nr:NADP-specific glutamate dehydrogenase [Geomicrobium sp. JCM 19039]GAK10829.1 NADP-specific glutamate dehydrogenase [Geomicrobium sp. JCM 19039]